jgi:membrane protein
VLALFPFLLFAVALASYVISPATIHALLDELAAVSPGPVAQLVGARVVALQQSQHGGLLTFGAVAAIYATSSGISSLIDGLNRAYDVVETRPFWKRRGIALLTTLCAGLMALVAALIAVAVPAVAKAIGGPIGLAIDWARLPAAGLLMMVLWALLYRFLPNVKLPFKILTPGSLSGVLIWIAASWGFSMYVKHFGKYEITYGAMGGVIVLLIWMWVSAQVLLLGAEINKLLAPDEKKAAIRGNAEQGTETAFAGHPAHESEPAPRRAPSAPPSGRPPSPPSEGVRGALYKIGWHLVRRGLGRQ